LIVGLLLAAALAGCGRGGGARVEGEVRTAGGMAGGAAVEFYLGPLSSGASAPFVVAHADASGVFAAEIPPGDYWLTARHQQPDGTMLVGEWPGNPLKVGPGSVSRAILEVAPTAAARVYRGPSDSGLRGRLLHGGKPAAGAFVYVYEGAGTAMRGPGYLTAERVAPDGSFRIGLHPGKYWVAFRRKRDGARTGLVSEGDLTADYPGNPVRIEAARFRDVGSVELHPADRAAVAAAGGAPAGSTGLSGTLRRTDGALPPGLRVLAYEHPQMIGRPAALAVADAAGAFSLTLPRGGRYYVGARQQPSGPRRPGEIAGSLAGSDDHGVEVADGEWRRNLAIEVVETW
jgi:hypothetical protein